MSDTKILSSADIACCPHLVVAYNTDNYSGTVTKSWWACCDCGGLFYHSSMYAAQAQRIKELEQFQSDSHDVLKAMKRERDQAQDTLTTCREALPAERALEIARHVVYASRSHQKEAEKALRAYAEAVKEGEKP